jgi:hypothetical protein
VPDDPAAALTARESTGVEPATVLVALDEVEQLVRAAGDLAAALERLAAGDVEIRELREALAFIADVVAKVRDGRTPAVEERG